MPLTTDSLSLPVFQFLVITAFPTNLLSIIRSIYTVSGGEMVSNPNIAQAGMQPKILAWNFEDQDFADTSPSL